MAVVIATVIAMKKVPDHISLKMHGHWVRHKKFGWEGRIAYYDKNTRLVWVVWDPNYQSKNKWKQKGTHSGGHKASELTLLKGYEPEPWYKES
jgi:hypothetical protein